MLLLRLCCLWLLFASYLSHLHALIPRANRSPTRVKMSIISGDGTSSAPSPLFRVRTITIFVNLKPSMFPSESNNSTKELSQLITKSCEILNNVKGELEKRQYEVQTVRIATNPFGEWLLSPTNALDVVETRLAFLSTLLQENDIQFCSLGPAETVEEISLACATIVRASSSFSCSAKIDSVESAKRAAQCILELSKTTPGGLGNFRFCAAGSCKPFIPFFPAAKSQGSQQNDGGIVGFAVGLENGALAKSLLQECKTIDNISTVFSSGMASAILPVQSACESASRDNHCPYLGIDTSLNPSLDEGGSVAEAIECLEEVRGGFGGRGTLAAAAAITTALQSLPEIKLTGYCGLMLPVCEDTRLAELASQEKLQIPDILSISSVCGVGIDTVPIPGDCSEEMLASLILDVAAVAKRWNKSLSCRVFPVPRLQKGERTTFDSPYMCNCNVLSL